MGMEIKVKCPLCGAMIPSNALRCSHCAGDLDKEDLKEKMKKQARTMKTVVAVITVLFFVFIVWIVGYSYNDNPSGGTATRENRTSESMAFIQSQDYVKKILKSPSTADFPLTDYSHRNNGNVYTITSYVDSQNGFGAMIRSDYTATLRYLGGDDANSSSWELQKLIFDGEIIYEK